MLHARNMKGRRHVVHRVKAKRKGADTNRTLAYAAVRRLKGNGKKVRGSAIVQPRRASSSVAVTRQRHGSRAQSPWCRIRRFRRKLR